MRIFKRPPLSKKQPEEKTRKAGRVLKKTTHTFNWRSSLIT